MQTSPARSDLIRVLVQMGLRTDQLQGLPSNPTWIDIHTELERITTCQIVEIFSPNDLPSGCIGLSKSGCFLSFFEHEANGNLRYFVDALRENFIDINAFNHTEIQYFFLRVDPIGDAGIDDGSIIGSPRIRVQIKKPILELLLFSFVTNAIAAAVPIIVSVMIDKVIVHNDLDTLIVLSVLLFFLILSESVLAFSKNHLFNFFSTQFTSSYGDRLFRRLLSLPLHFMKGEALGALITRVQTLNTINYLITDTALVFVIDIIFLCFFMISMVWLSPTLTAGTFAIFLVFAILNVIFSRVLGEKYGKLFEANSYYQTLLVEALHGAESIKTLAIGGVVRSRLEHAISYVLNCDFERRTISNIQDILALLLTRLSGLFVIGYGALQVIGGQLTLGQLIAFYVLLGMLVGPLQRVAHLLGSFNELRVAVTQVKELFKIESEREVSAHSLDRWTGRVELSKVSFTYPGATIPTLHDVSLIIEPGSVVAVVGDSGSGKSTLAKLLGGLMEPSAGHILYGNVPGALVHPERLRSLIAHASQDSSLFEGTVLENILIGSPNANLDDAMQSVRLAHADGFISQLPDQYTTLIRERGLNLSGGQRQRLVLAREFVRNTPVLILDEATNAIDESTEESIFSQMLEHFDDGKRTIIFITHNLALAKKADLIVNIVNGKSIIGDRPCQI